MFGLSWPISKDQGVPRSTHHLHQCRGGKDLPPESHSHGTDPPPPLLSKGRARMSGGERLPSILRGRQTLASAPVQATLLVEVRSEIPHLSGQGEVRSTCHVQNVPTTSHRTSYVVGERFRGGIQELD